MEFVTGFPTSDNPRPVICGVKVLFPSTWTPSSAEHRRRTGVTPKLTPLLFGETLPRGGNDYETLVIYTKCTALLAEQQRIVTIADPQERYRAIAHEYVRSHQAGNSTLVVSPANDERRALNEAIRAQLKSEDLLGKQDYAATLLVSRDLTGAQRARAASYQPGDVIRYSRGSRAHGFKAGDHAVVQSTEADDNHLRVTKRDGRTATYDPRRLKGVQVFREEPRAFAEGERVQFRLPHRELGIANGQFETIGALDPTNGDVTLRLGRQRESKLNLKSFPHFDRGYAVTSHASQGATVDRVLIDIDTTRSRRLVNRQQFYVSLSRARHDALIFTDSRETDPTKAWSQTGRGRTRRYNCWLRTRTFVSGTSSQCSSKRGLLSQLRSVVIAACTSHTVRTNTRLTSVCPLNTGLKGFSSMAPGIRRRTSTSCGRLWYTCMRPNSMLSQGF